MITAADDLEDDPLDLVELRWNMPPAPYKWTGFNPWAGPDFADQWGWLERRRAVCLAEIAELTAMLEQIEALPAYRGRGKQLKAIFRQQDGASRSLERINMMLAAIGSAP